MAPEPSVSPQPHAAREALFPALRRHDHPWPRPKVRRLIRGGRRDTAAACGFIADFTTRGRSGGQESTFVQGTRVILKELTEPRSPG